MRLFWDTVYLSTGFAAMFLWVGWHCHQYSLQILFYWHSSISQFHLHLIVAHSCCYSCTKEIQPLSDYRPISVTPIMSRPAKIFVQQWLRPALLIEFLKCQYAFYRAMLCIRGTSHGPVSVSVRLSQVGVLLKRLNESGWFLACELPSTRPTLCQKEIWLSPKIRALPSGTLS